MCTKGGLEMTLKDIVASDAFDCPKCGAKCAVAPDQHGVIHMQPTCVVFDHLDPADFLAYVNGKMGNYAEQGLPERLAVVQGTYDGSIPKGEPGAAGGTVPWHVHLEAWAGYAKAGYGGQSAERINQRGGFGYGEIQCAIAGDLNYGWVGCKVEHPPVPGWKPR